MAAVNEGLSFLSNVDSTTVLIFSLTFLIAYMLLNQRDKRVPPGPFLIPVVGNLFSLMSADPLAKFARLRKKYGDIYGLYVGRELTVVFNGYDVITDALVKQGRLFSHRPITPFFEAVDDYTGFVCANDKRWKEQRVLVQNALQSLCLKKGTQHIDRLILTGVNKLLNKLEDQAGTPVNLKSYLQISAASIVTNIILGKSFGLDDERFKDLLTTHSQNLTKVPMRIVLVNCFSFLLKLPMDIFDLKSIVQTVLTWETFMDERPLDQEEDGTGNDIIAIYQAAIKENQEKNLGQSYTRDNMRNSSFELAIAGTDTTATTINWLLLYLLHNPEIASRLQEEVDDVIGRERPPSLMDRPHMPYLEATILETLRIANAVPMAVPHSVPHSVYYKGYLIPKDTSILINLHSVLMDPEIWPEPTQFRPERFLSTDQKTVIVPKYHIPFSVGPRSCLGESFAKMELFLFIAATLQRFNLKCPDSARSLPPIKGNLRVTFEPESFKLCFTKR